MANDKQGIREEVEILCGGIKCPMCNNALKPTIQHACNMEHILTFDCADCQKAFLGIDGLISSYKTALKDEVMACLDDKWNVDDIRETLVKLFEEVK